MTRLLYRLLIALHPPRFRREFGLEMLWIFDQASASQGAAPLLSDGLRSLCRQWLLRSGSWKAVAALVLALLQIDLICRFGPPRIARQATGLAHVRLDMTIMIYLVVWITGGLIVSVIILANWNRRIAARRRAISRRGRPCSSYAR